MALVMAFIFAGCTASVPSSRSASAYSQVSSIGASVSSTFAKGVEPFVLVVVGFAGDANGEGAVSYRDDLDWHAMAFGNDRGISRFYSDQSFGAFTWSPAHETSAFGEDGNTCTADARDDGIVHVTLSRGHGHWFASGQDSNSSGGIDIGNVTDEQASYGQDFDQCTVEALREAAKFIDFASYDTNGSGTIDSDELGVGVMFAGYDIDGDWMHMLGETEYPRMQSHTGGPFNIGFSRGSNIIPDQAIIMGELITRVPENRVDDAQVDPSAIEIVPCPLSTLAHELGHYLNLPDYYDTSYDETALWSSWNAGYLSVMDAGAVVRVSNGDGSYDIGVTGFDPLSREKLGWLQSQTIKSSGTYEVRADGTAGGKNVLRVPTDRQGEYFLIENRQPTGYDAALAGQFGSQRVGGIVVWHVDENMYGMYLESNQVNLPSHHPALTVQYLMNTGAASGSGDGRTLSFSDGTALDTGSAFWDSATAQERFAELGVDAFQLWVYGEGDSADDPLAREYCGISLTFPDASANVMHVDISFTQ